MAAAAAFAVGLAGFVGKLDTARLVSLGLAALLVGMAAIVANCWQTFIGLLRAGESAAELAVDSLKKMSSGEPLYPQRVWGIRLEHRSGQAIPPLGAP